MLKKLLKKIFPDPNKKALEQLAPFVKQVNVLEQNIKALSDTELSGKTDYFRQQFKAGVPMQEMLPEIFAVVREASVRTLGMRHFDVQLIGGHVLYEGKIAEMKTGEGKTLVAPMAAYANAISGKTTHIVTVNDYLAKRDAGWMGGIYKFLGLKVSYIVHELSPEERKEAYRADVVYGTNNELGFDYLRDNMTQDPDYIVQSPLDFAIIDEVDSILIDEARTPLIISAPAEESTQKYYQYAQLIPKLDENVDYDIDHQTRSCSLTEEGIAKLEKNLGVENIYTEVGITEVHHIEQALKAHALFKRDIDYVVKDGEVVIVDEFTGRLMPGRRYSSGLHQAIEAKEDVEVRRESRTLATITFQNYFRLYKKLAGMTGTAVTEAEEFHNIYGLETIVIPTDRPCVRKDAPDKIYKNERGKFQAVIEDIRERHAEGQPVLVGSISIEKSEALSSLLKKANIPHQVLNAKYHEKEAAIVAQAGRKGTVTIATNMAGRGTDIILGGNPEFLAKNQTGGVDKEEFEKALKRFKEICAKEQEEVIAAGGLHILGTERHEARRIDNQLRGRAGRQGDPGSSCFFISLEDNLMKLFGSDRIARIMNTLKVPDDLPIENKMVSSSIESAQRRIEAHNFDIRKHVLEYDEVLNKHRNIIYGRRRNFLEAKLDELEREFDASLESELTYLVNRHTDKHGIIDSQELFEALAAISNEFQPRDFGGGELAAEKTIPVLVKRFKEIKKQKLFDFIEEIRAGILRQILLRTTDVLWMEHIDNMTHLRDSVSLHGYGQRDPLISYKQEAYTMFERLLTTTRSNSIRTFYKMQFEIGGGGETAAGDIVSAPATLSKLPLGTPKNAKRGVDTDESQIDESLAGFAKSSVQSGSLDAPATITTGSNTIKNSWVAGRNDQCPCGSGKKYKKCCGK